MRFIFVIDPVPSYIRIAIVGNNSHPRFGNILKRGNAGRTGTNHTNSFLHIIDLNVVA